jgi:hypothetical protein
VLLPNLLLLLLLLLLLCPQSCKLHLPDMQPEACVHAGYALARNGHLPSNGWRKAYIRAVTVSAWRRRGLLLLLLLLLLLVLLLLLLSRGIVGCTRLKWWQGVHILYTSHQHEVTQRWWLGVVH